MRSQDPTGEGDRRPGTPGHGGPPPGARYRSFCFLDRQGERWTVFLVTFPTRDGRCRGYFSFRSAAADRPGDEIRTADLFMEESEAEVDARARGLGRPLVLALLDSAIHTRADRTEVTEDAQRRLSEALAKHSAELVPDLGGSSGAEPSLSALRSLYDSYRMDQMVHLIALIQPRDFTRLVERVLDGREIDFRTRDRLQLAMLVVQELETHLPLPPFETWVDDYLENRELYRRYTHRLHREASLP